MNYSKNRTFFINSLNSSDLGFESEYFSELFTPWICIYLWIRKSCGSNGSRSLGLVWRDFFFMVLVHILPLGSGPGSRKPKMRIQEIRALRTAVNVYLTETLLSLRIGGVWFGFGLST